MNAAAAVSRHCGLAAAALGLVLLLVVLLVVWPWVAQNRSVDEAVGERVEQRSRLQRLVARRPQLETELEQVRQAAAKTHYYIEASTAAVGAAELQKLVKRIIDAHQGKLISTQALPGQNDGGVERIAIRVRMTIGLEGLAPVMYALEGGRPLLFVDNLSIRSRTVRRRSRRAVTVKKSLDVRYDLAGYMQGKRS